MQRLSNKKNGYECVGKLILCGCAFVYLAPKFNFSRRIMQDLDYESYLLDKYEDLTAHLLKAHIQRTTVIILAMGFDRISTTYFPPFPVFLHLSLNKVSGFGRVVR